MNKQIARSLATGALVLGAAGASFLIPNLVAAADPTASPAASPATTSGGSGSTQTNSGSGTTTADCANGAHFGPGGLDADDLTAAAQALGMTEADLTTALDSGQTVADVASTQKVDLQTVIDAIVAADTAQIQADVSAGTITQAQADQRLANLTAHVTNEVNGIAQMGGPNGAHFGPGGLDADDLTAAAQALGMTEADLTTALDSGQTVADVASTQKVDLQTVIDAIVAADTAQIQADVSAGTITQAQADQRLANLTAHVTNEVNGIAQMGGPNGFDGPGYHGQAN